MKTFSQLRKLPAPASLLVAAIFSIVAAAQSEPPATLIAPPLPPPPAATSTPVEAPVPAPAAPQPAGTPATPAQIAELRAEAERFYAEKSYSLALEKFRALASLQLPPAEKAYADFRVADCEWRNLAATRQSDHELVNAPRGALEQLSEWLSKAADAARPPRLFAEIQESLGDSWWLNPQFRNWDEAWPHYERALEWWAGSTDIGVARDRYLAIVFKASQPDVPVWRPWSEPYGQYARQLPLQVVLRASKIAATPADRAHTQYLLALCFASSGDPAQMLQVPAAYEAAIALGGETPWFDDALFAFAQWMENTGAISFDERGNMQQQPDYPKALALYRRLIEEIPAGDSRFRRGAEDAIWRITRPQLSVDSGGVFLPGSLNEVFLNWRNVEGVRVDIYPVDFARDVKFPAFRESTADDAPPTRRGNLPPRREVDVSQWWEAADLAGKTAARTLAPSAKPASPYAPVQEKMLLDPGLAPGAYVLSMTAGEKRARAGLIVTDQAVVLKAGAGKAAAYLAQAESGKPQPEAAFTVLLGVDHDSDSRTPRRWERRELKADKDGLLQFDISTGANGNVQILLASAAPAAGDLPARPAYATGSDWGGQSDEYAQWRTYVFADRPAYRPGETVSWKFFTRQYRPLSGYTVPADARLNYEILDAQGQKLAGGDVTLNIFGAASGEVKLPADAKLGMCQFILRQGGNHLGQSEIFRVEEYKLPEYKVAVSTGKSPDGGSPAYRLGQTVPVEIKADYYFGGPVADAEVELMVFKRPYHPWWGPRPLYPWLRNDEMGNSRFRRYGYGEEMIETRTVRTDAQGVAQYSLETPGFSEGDLEYRVVANVTDSSRRQITGEARVRVTHQSFFAFLDPQNRVVRPGGDLVVRLKTLNANDKPLPAKGKVTIVRRESVEIFVDRDGKEYTAAQLRAFAQGGGLLRLFSSSAPRVTLKERRVRTETIATLDVSTDADGDGVVRQTVAKPGLYEIIFASPDAPAPPVRATASVYACDEKTVDMDAGGGMRLIVDKDAFKAGQNAPAVVMLPSSGGAVLFTVESETILSAQLLALEGDAKFLNLAATDAWVPNVRLAAVAVRDLGLLSDTAEVQVPPSKNFLNIIAEFNQARFQPRGEGVVKISVTDDNGAPVPNADVALAVVDDAVFYIQPELADDPRPFFWNQQRHSRVQLSSTFNYGQYRKLARPEAAPADVVDVAMLEKDAGGVEMLGRTVAGNRGGGGGGGGGMRSENGFSRSEALAFASAPAPAMMDAAAARSPMTGAVAEQQMEGVSAPEPNIVVRADFKSSILWKPDLRTGPDGTVSAPVLFPDNTTGWRATARAVALPTKVGWGDATAETQLPLIARLQAPRFFVTGDRVVVSGVFNNNTDAPLAVRPTLDAGGLEFVNFQPPGGGPLAPALAANGTPAPVTAPSKGEARVDWMVAPAKPGEVKISLKGVSGNIGDAMEKTYPVFEHGIDKFTALSGKIPAGSGDLRVDLPPRKADGQSFTVQLTPSLAVSLLDALPYLVNYPYGCTEQTMSRFLPAVIVTKTLRDLGADPADIAGKVFGGVEPATAARANPPPRTGAASLAQLNDVTSQGLARLYDFQHGSGGWGWWKEGADDLYMTAYVTWGLTLAQQADVAVKPEVLQSARAYLDQRLVEAETQFDLQAWLLHALAARFAVAPADARPSRAEAAAFANLFRNRDQLNAFTRALLTISARNLNFADEARTLAQNLRDGVKLDSNPRASVLVSPAAGGAAQPFAAPTAHWGADGVYYRWSDGGVEATAFALMALLAAEPGSDLVGPVAQWLVQNRRGAQWSNTRDSAICVLALAQYLRASGELREGLQAEVLVNGAIIGRLDIAPGAAAAVRAPSVFRADPSVLRDGANTVTLRRTGGNAPMYFSARANYFTLENPIAAAGHEVFVRRQYFRVKLAPTLLEGVREALEPVGDGARLEVGDQIEVALYVEGKNNLEYMMFEDLKPAGCEALALRSGEHMTAREVRPAKLDELLSGLARPGESGSRGGDGDIIPLGWNAQLRIAPAPGTGSDGPYTGRERMIYQELRDRQITSFADKLPEGTWEIRYRLRAEIPGYFHALPVLGEAMYVPEICANSDEIRLSIAEPPADAPAPPAASVASVAAVE